MYGSEKDPVELLDRLEPVASIAGTIDQAWNTHTNEWCRS